LDEAWRGRDTAVTSPASRQDRTLRFGCGALTGLALGGYGALTGGQDGSHTLLIASVTALVIGLLTLRFGERVLKFLLDWFAF